MSVVGGLKTRFVCIVSRNGPRLVDYNHKLMCIPPTHTSPFSGLKVRKNLSVPTSQITRLCVCVCVGGGGGL